MKSQLFLTCDSPQILDEVKSNLVKTNPDFLKMKRMGYPTHNTPPSIVMYEKSGKGILAPRCSLEMIRQVCAKHNERVLVKDNRTVVDEINVGLKDVQLFWYQEKAIKVMDEKQHGIVVAPCGAGKSIIGLAFIAKKKKPTMIIVHTLELFRQWEDEIKKHLYHDGTIGRIGGGHKSLGNITIAMIQTLVKMSEKEWNAINNTFEILIGDEAHHFGAESYMKIMKRNSAKYSIGLTATPKRKDGKNFIVSNYLGKVIYEITDNDLSAMGRSLDCYVRMVNTGCVYNYSKMNEILAVLNSVIAKDEKRNKIILECIGQDVEDGRTILVLTDRIIQGKILNAKLRSEGYKTDIIVGAIDKDIRAKIKSKMIENKLQILVANKQIAAEGLNIPNIDSVHVCFWTSNTSLLKQMIGRGRRATDNKEHCRVWLYKDRIMTVQLDEITFKEKLVEAQGFKYTYGKIRSWLLSQNFEVKECNQYGEEID